MPGFLTFRATRSTLTPFALASRYPFSPGLTDNIPPQRTSCRRPPSGAITKCWSRRPPSTRTSAPTLPSHQDPLGSGTISTPHMWPTRPRPGGNGGAVPPRGAGIAQPRASAAARRAWIARRSCLRARQGSAGCHALIRTASALWAAAGVEGRPGRRWSQLEGFLLSTFAARLNRPVFSSPIQLATWNVRWLLSPHSGPPRGRTWGSAPSSPGVAVATTEAPGKSPPHKAALTVVQ